MCPGSIISHEECEMGAAGQIFAIEFNWSQFRLKLLFLLRAGAIKDNCYKANKSVVYIPPVFIVDVERWK